MNARPALPHRLRRGHRIAAAVVLNTLVLVLVVEGALAVVFGIRDRQAAVSVDLYGALDDATLAKLYPQHGRRDVTRLWQELVQSFVYEPFTEFAEHPRHGTFVNVDAAGFRHGADQGPWPPELDHVNVFVFGGSTTFGYGAADADTIASRLQPLLARRRSGLHVYNFGRGYYYSTQERILFAKLLAAGHVPAVAIFIDGLNDFGFEHDDTAVSARLATALETPGAASFGEWLATTHVGRAADAVRYRLAGTSPSEPVRELDDDTIRRVIGRYLANKRLIEAEAAAYGVTPIFVWQPVPMYHYDVHDHLFAARGFLGSTRVRRGYEVMAEVVQTHPVGGHFLWLADVQADLHDPLYVDIVHYAPPFAARVAALIDARITDLVAAAGVPPRG